jgi:hypothetical protein
MNRTRLFGAVRDRMRSRTAGVAEIRSPVAAAAPPDRPRRAPEPAHDDELERLAAEARYHRDRFDLYQARVRSASSRATSLGRLRELERTATAAADRLAHAQRTRGGAAQ